MQNDEGKPPCGGFFIFHFAFFLGLVQPLQGWKFWGVTPPVPHSLRSRSTGGYSSCALAAL